jgi:hypothetical protein
MNHDLDPDPELTSEQQAFAANLNQAQLEIIDQFILSECIPNWYKVARIAGRAFLKFYDQYPILPDVFYSQRIYALVKAGKLESQGNLKRMRYSEVRLPSALTDET